MKKYCLLLILSALSVGFGHRAAAQELKPIKRYDVVPEPHHCPVSYEPSPHYVPRREVKREKNQELAFSVTYQGNIKPQAKLAFENGALKLLSELFSSPVPINIHVEWTELAGNTLAAASPTGYYSRVPNSPNPSVIYPTALAEKIYGAPINPPDEPDINISVDSTINWYYEYENPSMFQIGNRFDFVSVMLHELFHGLGFTALTTVSNNLGFIRIFSGGNHSIYADFLANGSGKKISELRDSTTEMAQVLRNNNLFFNLISNPWRAKVYAPSTFQGGSSISHLDQSTYELTESSLMTPSVRPARIELDPGIALDMMYDMGWDMTYMFHTPPAGQENFTQDQLLEVKVQSDSEYDANSLVIHYSRDSFELEDVVEKLILNPETGLYEATLPAPNAESAYQYYFSVSNSRNITFTNPGKAPSNYFQYRYQIDRELPVVRHTSPGKISDVDSSFVVEAEITDEYLGVKTAAVQWRINGAPQEPVAMEKQGNFFSDNIYRATLVFPNGPLGEADVVEYQIVAVDKSKAGNTATAPQNGFWTLAVIPVPEAVVTYINDFDTPTDDFIGDGFSITDYPGFSSQAIHSAHPYPESGERRTNSFTYELKIPIIIRDERPLIRFEEIVLVEIGEAGTAYGDPEFWDYVIVEGKKVGGSEWVPFLDGYDSGANTEWKNAYNGKKDGSPSLYFPRTIDMTANGRFAPGDKVFIRFRLFSDPFANGWGWAIDNLHIQDNSTAVEDFVRHENFRVYPNPANGDEITVALDLERLSEALEISLFDLYGRRLAVYPIGSGNNTVRQRISLAGLPAGMYIVHVAFNGRDRISRKIIRN